MKVAKHNVTLKSKVSGQVGKRPGDHMIKGKSLGQVGVGGGEAKREDCQNCRKFTCLTTLLTAAVPYLHSA